MESNEFVDLPPQPKRFKHQSYHQSLKEVHPPSAFQQSHLDHEVGDNESHFHDQLERWRQLNLSPSFVQFASKADALSASMALLLHNWREIYLLWLDAFKLSDDEGFLALLDLLQKMTHDLRTTLSPIYIPLLEDLLSLLSRNISAKALTSLLETLSSLFRHLLVPAVNTELIEQTWLLLCSILPKCLGEIQRAMAEVWGAVLRKLKTSQREKAVILLAENTAAIEDASAWAVVYACKSVSQTLHTCAPSIIEPLLTYHLSSFDSKLTFTLLRRSLTALIHHVKNEDQFCLIGGPLIDRFTSLLKDMDSSKPEVVESTRRMLEIMSVFCGVRQGSRLTESQKASLFSDLSIIPLRGELSSALLRYVTSLFMACDMSLWLDPGLKFLQRTWSLEHGDIPSFPAMQISFTLKLHLCLADVGWGGWKLVALPTLLKSVFKPELLSVVEHRKLIGFLAALQRMSKLNGQTDLDIVWRRRVEDLIEVRLKEQSWRTSSRIEMVTDLSDTFALLPLCSNPLTNPLIDIINSFFCFSNTESENHDESSVPTILGLSMQALSKQNAQEWATRIDLTNWTLKGLQKWSGSHEFISGIVALAEACPSRRLIPLLEIHPSLCTSLISHSRRLRLAALRLLDSKLIDPLHDQGEVLKRCLQGEEVSLDIQGVRERVLRIGRVGQVVGDDKGADLCARWLIAQLKVNLRPLWSPAAAALASLSQRFGDLVWKLLFDELKHAVVGTKKIDNLSSRPQSSLELNQVSRDEQQQQNLLDSYPWEEERTWRDPSAHKVRSVVVIWDDPDGEKKLSEKELDEDRFDLESYEHQLLSTLCECCALVQKHNREIVPHFLALNDQRSSSFGLSKTKLIAWLTLFSKFSNPKALYATDALRSLYMGYLSHPDRSIQSISLSCLFTYKSPYLTPYEDRIKLLLDDTRWRDELALLDVDGIPEASRSEVMNLIVRLLFGIMLERKGRGRGGGADRRAAVLSTFAVCTDQELGLMVDLMLSPFGWSRSSCSSHSGSQESTGFLVEYIDIGDKGSYSKHGIGYLTLLGDVLKALGSRLVVYWPALLGMTVNLTAAAQARIEGSGGMTGNSGQVDETNVVEDIEAVDSSITSANIARSIRHLGVKRFADFFRIPVLFDFGPFLPAAFASFITPRLPVFDKENTQAPSALLELFHVWTVDGVYIPLLVDFNVETLPKIYDCLIAPNVKPSVISRIFDIVDNILSCSVEDDYTRDSVLKPFVTQLLANLSLLVEKNRGHSTLSTQIGQRQIHILSEIAQYSTNAEQASMLLTLFNPLLRRPAKLVSEKVKVGLVKILGELLHLIPEMKDKTSATYLKTYGLLSQLFQSLRSRAARLSLVTTFARLASIDASLLQLSKLLESMNAYLVKRIDEPDFDRRMNGLTLLNEELYKTISASDWLPILYNMLNFIQDPVELAVRNSASYSMRRFIDLVSAKTSVEYENTFLKVLYPGLKNGLRSKNDLVRSEVLNVLAYAVSKCEGVGSLKEMQVLLEAGDEEANFFNNILHIQIHRRSRALRRLGDYCDEGYLRSTTIAEIFVPLVSNYITSTSSLDHHLVNDAILTTGRMAKQLSWGPYNALVQKYLKLSKERDAAERVYVRTLVALLDNFHFPMDEVVEAPELNNDEVVEDEDEEDAVDRESEGPKHVTQNTARIADSVNLHLLPSLLNHLEKNDPNADDNTRIPISIGIVTVAKHLPTSIRDFQVARLLTILSQILRSKSQETRDLTRESLNRIAVILGPSYLPVILRELRGALLRGPQLHVLAYAVHSLIVHVTTGEHAEVFVTLDECVNDVAYVSAEVIFGESGKDVEAEDFKTKVREVRASSSRGLDSFGITSKYISPARISSLLVPVKTVMQETGSIKVMNLVDEVLKRISTGLNSNQHLVPTELLVLCNTLISQNAKFLQQTPSRRKNDIKDDVIVQMKRKVVADVDHYANNSFRFVTFGLELLDTALKRNRFDFQDPAHLARLESIVIVVGNTLYSTNASVLILGMRCAAGLIKCPLKSVEKALPVFVRQILDIIKQTGNAESDVVQSAFKCLGTILRDGPPVQVKERDLVYLIELVSPDLEEPSRQASVFTLLRAIVARKFVVPEIYDLMEKVSEVSVTSQSQQVQELCRGVLLQFLLDYPQGKGRLRKQMAFFAKNLSYIHESGRLSIMNLLGAIVVKFQTNLILEYADLLFVALVMVVANDESAKCREMAAQLIKNIWSRLDQPHRKSLLSHLHTWAIQSAQPLLTCVSAQVYGFVVDVDQVKSSAYISAILEDLRACLKDSVRMYGNNSEMEAEIQWQLPYHSLTVLAKILRVFPDFATQEDKVDWVVVVDLLLFPHAWVRTAASRLMGLYFNAWPVAAPKADLPDKHPFSVVGMQEVARMSTQQLKSEHLDQALSLQVVKNLFYLGKCFYLLPVGDIAATEEDVEDLLDESIGDINLAHESSKSRSHPLPWLFSKLSYQIKSGHISRRSKASGKPNWSQQPLAGLRWFAAMTSHMDPLRLEQFLIHILTPVYRLTEDDTIRDSQMEELKTTAAELQDLVQSRVGTTKFANVYNQIRQSVLSVRRERKLERVLMASTHPEVAAKRKIQRNVIKKDSRKRKERIFLEGRGKFKRRREE